MKRAKAKSPSQLLQSPQLDELRKTASHDELRGSWLFVGEPGLGKSTFVEELIEQMHGVQKDRDPDLVWLEKPGVEEMRDATRTLSLTPNQADSKILVVENAQEMNRHSANALLKTLEEPPEYGLIILTADWEHKLLPTIISRCFKVKLNPVDDSRISDWLTDNFEIDSETVRNITKLAQGRPFLAHQFAESEAKLKDYREEVEELQSLLDGDLSRQLLWTKQLSKEYDLESALSMMIEILKGKVRAGDYTAKDKLSAIESAWKMIRNNLNPKLVLTYTFLKLDG